MTVARNRAFDYLRSVRNAPEEAPVSFTDLEQTGYFSVDISHSQAVGGLILESADAEAVAEHLVRVL